MPETEDINRKMFIEWLPRNVFDYFCVSKYRIELILGHYICIDYSNLS
jgi:hypothetical protein